MDFRLIDNNYFNQTSLSFRGKTKLVSNPLIQQNLKGTPKLADNLTKDVCDFSQVDKSLESEFLKGLLKIEGKNFIDTCTKIKDELLKAMGYKHPEILKVVHGKAENASAEYMFLSGEINVCETNASKEKTIAILRHELDHMDKLVKLYKTKGKESFAEAIISYRKHNGIKTSENVEDILKELNTDFYENMSKDASVSGFDTEKYYNSLCNYTNYEDDFESGYKYYKNPLEKAAFAVEKKVLRALGQDPTVSADRFPKNYKTMIQILKEKGVHKDWHESVLNNLWLVARIKETETPLKTNRFIRIYKNIQNGEDIPNADRQWAIKMLNNIKKTGCTKETEQRAYQQVETWLRENKFTIEDLV